MSSGGDIEAMAAGGGRWAVGGGRCWLRGWWAVGGERWWLRGW